MLNGFADVPDLRGKRVLITDDCDIDALILEKIIRAAGATTERAINGREALQKFICSDCGYYNYLFMDFNMPCMTGCEASDCIRKLDREDAKKVPIFIVSSEQSIENTAPVDKCLPKPADRQKIYSALREVL